MIKSNWSFWAIWRLFNDKSFSSIERFEKIMNYDWKELKIIKDQFKRRIHMIISTY